MIVLVLAQPQSGQLQIIAEGDGANPETVAQYLTAAAQIAQQQAEEARKPRIIVPPPSIPPNLNGRPPQ